MLHVLKEVRVNEEDQTPVFGAALPNPPSGFINEHGGGNNASILTTTDALDSIWKTVRIEEHACLSEVEEFKWLALCQERRVMEAVTAKCEELGIPEGHRPFLPVLAAHTDVDGATAMFKSPLANNVPITQQEVAAMQRVFAIRMPKLDMTKYGDFKDIAAKCAAITTAVSRSADLHRPNIQALLKEVALIQVRALRGMVRLHNAAILLGVLAEDNMSSDALLPMLQRIPPVVGPLDGRLVEPAARLTADPQELLIREPAPTVTNSNSSIACEELRMIDLGHALTAKPTSQQLPNTIGRLPVLASVSEEDQTEDENLWTITPHHHAPEFALMLAKGWAGQRATRHEQEADSEVDFVSVDGWESGCGITDEGEMDRLEGKLEEQLRLLQDRGLYLPDQAKMWVGEAAIIFGVGLEALSVLMGEVLQEYMERIRESFQTTEQPSTIHQLRLRVAIENGLSWADRLPKVLPPPAQSSASTAPTPPSLFLRTEPCMEWAREVGVMMRELVVDCVRPMPWERMERLPQGLVTMDGRLMQMEERILDAHWGTTTRASIPSPLADPNQATEDAGDVSGHGETNGLVVEGVGMVGEPLVKDVRREDASPAEEGADTANKTADEGESPGTSDGLAGREEAGEREAERQVDEEGTEERLFRGLELAESGRQM
ncbi:unnamed protein product [Vitrella brassicaformis CCMP3155]|uniref:Uncharacterized protein n=1 Tax=Vitrella brassicaformis (strain CCMP3155) TaxID=1169540 RepID=A0A0G4ECU4_VITBC|nr:unnamed protein product [Vitrella brassicaformis CCMP3155]|eukprot:CEL93370.1 unnamed protein product [Vitrella brassicaformis CCMP3155]